MPKDPDVPTSAYEWIGRVVVAAAMFEYRLTELAAQVESGGNLDRTSADQLRDILARHQGKRASELLAYVEKHGVQLVHPNQEEALCRYIAEARAALGRRDDVVHNVWLSVEHPDGDLFGFRGLPKSKRVDGMAFTDSVWGEANLRALVDELARLEHWLAIWDGRIQNFGPRRRGESAVSDSSIQEQTDNPSQADCPT